MARLPRIVISGVAHHITQRGNRRLPVFFTDEDRRLYLDLLADAARASGTRCLAWCLMDNHVHLILEFRGQYTYFARSCSARFMPPACAAQGRVARRRALGGPSDRPNGLRIWKRERARRWRRKSAGRSLGGCVPDSVVNRTDWPFPGACRGRSRPRAGV